MLQTRLIIIITLQPTIMFYKSFRWTFLVKKFTTQNYPVHNIRVHWGNVQILGSAWFQIESQVQ